MAKKVVHVTLNPAGIQKAIDELNAFKKWLEDCSKRFLDRLAQEGVEVASAGFASAEYDGTNDVVVRFEKDNDKRIIVATGHVDPDSGGNVVLFIEFGSGVKYTDPHPEAAEHGMIRGEFGMGQGGNVWGWTYRGNPGSNGMVINTGWQRGRVHTYGNPANKCMYNSRKELEERFTQIAKEVFRR